MGKRRINILLVEDSPSDADLLMETLGEIDRERFGFKQVESLGEALRALRQEVFDVLLLDLSLPDSSGTQTFVRARTEAPLVPIVVLTGFDNEALGIEAVRHGIQDYLIKGQLDGRQLARAIHYAIERKRIEAELEEARDLLAKQAKHLEKLVRERTARLEETVAELEHFSYSITHDMRAPLRAMQGFAEILLGEECPSCPKELAKGYLRRIATAAERMDHLITDALQFSQVVRTEFPLKPVDVGVLLRGMVESYPNLHPPQAEVSLEGSFPWVLANEAGLTQCLSNLLDNAVKFVAPGKVAQVKVWAEARTEGAANNGPSATDRSQPTVRIWVEDNGIGIAQEAQKKIFGMFQQLSAAYPGTGIGLALVRKAAQRMSGRVGVESTPGQGSRFWLEFQAAPPT